MNHYDFARKHFREFKTHGNEIIPTYCPYCNGGSSGDKHTFALNIDKLTFNCKRGSCGVSGTFSKLCRDFGEESDRPRGFEINYRPQKTYKAPKTEVKQSTKAVEEYLKSRGISEATWKRRGVGEDGKGNIAMPYYEGGKLVLMKFRPARTPREGEKKGWREEGGKPVFWGMDLCDPALPLVVVEGEIDALSLDEAKVKNVVSVPSGAEDLTCVDLCWEWLQGFRKIYIWVDNDEPGQKLQRNLINRLGAGRCWVVQGPYKDANEVLQKEGTKGIVNAIKSAVEVPISGLIRLADVKPFDYANAVRVRSGFRGIDQIMGGFIMGELTIWTGINSSGKSSLLGQVMLEAVEQEFAVCAYSGELSAAIFRYWIDLQAAGPNHLIKKMDSIKGKEVASVTPEAVRKIREWYRDRFFLYDSYGAAKDENLLEVFEYAVQRYNCKVFMIDNLMTTCYSGSENDFYRKQSEFIGKVNKFAKAYDVHVHLVAHPRKTTGRLTKMDVAGSGDITNRADNVLSVHRLSPKEKQEMDDPCDAVVEVFKNRFSGTQDVEIQLSFDPDSKRFYMASDKFGGFKSYSWVEEPDAEEARRMFGDD